MPLDALDASENAPTIIAMAGGRVLVVLVVVITTATRTRAERLRAVAEAVSWTELWRATPQVCNDILS